MSRSYSSLWCSTTWSYENVDQYLKFCNFYFFCIILKPNRSQSPTITKFLRPFLIAFQPSYAQLPAPGQGQLRIFNGFPCQVELDPPISGRNFIAPLGSLQWTDIPVNGSRSISETFVLNSGLPCRKIPMLKNWTTDIQIFEEQVSGSSCKNNQIRILR